MQEKNLMKPTNTTAPCRAQEALKPPVYNNDIEQWLNALEDWARASDANPLVCSIWRLRDDLRRAEGDLIDRIEYVEGELACQLEELRPKPNKKGDTR
jgi:hypothetical protein